MKTITYTIKIDSFFNDCNICYIEKNDYFFENNGYTAVFFLNEDSYATIHTWPEHSYARGTFYGIKSDYDAFIKQLGSDHIFVNKKEKQSTLHLSYDDLHTINSNDLIKALSEANMTIVKYKKHQNFLVFILAESHLIVDFNRCLIHCYTCGDNDSSKPLLNLLSDKKFVNFQISENHF